MVFLWFFHDVPIFLWIFLWVSYDPSASMILMDPARPQRKRPKRHSVADPKARSVLPLARWNGGYGAVEP